jgi:uncharacterized membrane protein YfcA
MRAYIEAEKLMQIAFVLPSAVVICWIGGWWLSHLLHQRWLELAGTLFGCIAGMVYVVKIAVAAERSTRMGDEDQNSAGKGIPKINP